MSNVTLSAINVNGQTYPLPSGGGGGSSTFAGLSDTSITSPTNGQIPVYNSTSQKWENSSNIIVTTTDPGEGSPLATGTLLVVLFDDEEE